MKKIIISFAVFILLIVSILFSLSYLNTERVNFERLCDNLAEYVDKDDWNNAYCESLKILEDWQTHSNIIAMYVDHTEIDNINNELYKLIPYVKNEEKGEVAATLNLLRYLIEHISNMEKITLKNIF